jgi:hypothetical protein
MMPHRVRMLLPAALLGGVILGCNPPPPRTSRSPEPIAQATPNATTVKAAPEVDANTAAAAFPPDETLKGEAVRIEGSDKVRGRATVVVDAPAAKVRATLLDFEKYPEFMPEFSRSRILGSLPDGGKQVYQEMSILGGTVRIWAHVKIPQADRRAVPHPQALRADLVAQRQERRGSGKGGAGAEAARGERTLSGRRYGAARIVRCSGSYRELHLARMVAASKVPSPFIAPSAVTSTPPSGRSWKLFGTAHSGKTTSSVGLDDCPLFVSWK